MGNQPIDFLSRQRIILPLDPEAKQVLVTWEANHRSSSRNLLLRFGKLHLAINAQKDSPRLDELKRLLSNSEDEMLEWYFELADGVVAKLQAGYGNDATITKYHEAVKAESQHQESYHRLRVIFDAFMDE